MESISRDYGAHLTKYSTVWREEIDVEARKKKMNAARVGLYLRVFSVVIGRFRGAVCGNVRVIRPSASSVTTVRIIQRCPEAITHVAIPYSTRRNPTNNC